MKRSALNHERVFTSPEMTEGYANKHRKMAENFGKEYTKKLRERGFEGGKILDAGCGFGGTAIVLAGEFPKSDVIGIDLSDGLLLQAKLDAQTAKLEQRVKFEKADVEDIPLDDDEFDVLLNLNMFHIVEDPVKMLNEMERVLKPDGILFIADIRRSWLGLIESEMKSAFTLDEARNIFAQSQLREGMFSSSAIWWRYEA